MSGDADRCLSPPRVKRSDDDIKLEFPRSPALSVDSASWGDLVMGGGTMSPEAISLDSEALKRSERLVPKFDSNSHASNTAPEEPGSDKSQRPVGGSFSSSSTPTTPSGSRREDGFRGNRNYTADASPRGGSFRGGSGYGRRGGGRGGGGGEGSNKGGYGSGLASHGRYGGDEGRGWEGDGAGSGDGSGNGSGSIRDNGGAFQGRSKGRLSGIRTPERPKSAGRGRTAGRQAKSPGGWLSTGVNAPMPPSPLALPPRPSPAGSPHAGRLAESPSHPRLHSESGTGPTRGNHAGVETRSPATAGFRKSNGRRGGKGYSNGTRNGFGGDERSESGTPTWKGKSDSHESGKGYGGGRWRGNGHASGAEKDRRKQPGGHGGHKPSSPSKAIDAKHARSPATTPTGSGPVVSVISAARPAADEHPDPTGTSPSAVQTPTEPDQADQAEHEAVVTALQEQVEKLESQVQELEGKLLSLRSENSSLRRRQKQGGDVSKPSAKRASETSSQTPIWAVVLFSVVFTMICVFTFVYWMKMALSDLDNLGTDE